MKDNNTSLPATADSFSLIALGAYDMTSLEVNRCKTLIALVLKQIDPQDENYNQIEALLIALEDRLESLKSSTNEFYTNIPQAIN